MQRNEHLQFSFELAITSTGPAESIQDLFTAL